MTSFFFSKLVTKPLYFDRVPFQRKKRENNDHDFGSDNSNNDDDDDDF